MKKAKVSQVFFSLQGEGPYLGTPHVFVRFFGCNIKCRYCDTNSNFFKEYGVGSLGKRVDKLIKKHNASYISLTGGEPLLRTDFICEFLKKIKTNRKFIYLETNGILYCNFLKIKNYIDIIAMDIKLPSATKIKPFWNEHSKFLRLCSDKEVFVKTIITLSTSLADIKKTVQLICRIDKNTPLVLQPNHGEISSKLVEKTVNFQNFALKKLADVRIIPQMHKILGIY